MAYYLVDITELPYPHGMAARGEHSNCPFAISTLRRTLRKPIHWSPGPQGYRELFNDESLLLRARNCDVHQGDWAVVLPVVVAFLAAIPAAADTLTIARAARSDPRFDSLTVDDRRLALALLSYSDSLYVYTTVHGHREATGQHRICAARTAGVTHLPVWYDSRSPRPPAAATLLQRAGGLFAGEEVEIPDIGGPHRGDWHRRQHRVPVCIDQARHQHSSTAVDLHSMLAVAGVDGPSGDRLDRGAADEDIRAV